MTGTGRCKEAKYNKMDLLILDTLRKDNSSVKVWVLTTAFRVKKEL
jgi:hypothetical protein